MKGQWMIWLLLTGFSYVSGSNCDTDPIEKPYIELLNYESKAFPFYGGNEAELEETCTKINNSYELVQSYIDACSENPECDGPCRELVLEMQAVNSESGLMNLAYDLCDEHSEDRQKYLESYVCLEKYSDDFSACFNKSEISKPYLATVTGQDAILARCCYYSWFFDCYTNITRDHCSKEATLFVTLGLQKLTGPITVQLCAESEITCSNPPLPHGEDDQEVSDKNKDDKDGTNEEKKSVKNNIKPDEDEEDGARTGGERKSVKKNDEPDENEDGDGTSERENSGKDNDKPDEKKEDEDGTSNEKQSGKGDSKPDEKDKDINDANKNKHEKGSATILSCSFSGTTVVVFFLLLVNLLTY